MDDRTPYDILIDALASDATVAPAPAPVGTFIEEFSFGRMKVGGVVYDKDLLIVPDGEGVGQYRVLPRWWRANGHQIAAPDIASALASGIKLLVIGIGTEGRVRVRPDATALVKRAGIELVMARTDEAWRIFNERCMAQRSAAALHLTC